MLTRSAFALLLLLPSTVSAQDLDTAVSAVVRISGTRNGTLVRGTGFVVSLERDKATIVTASHVIEGAEQLKVTFAADLTEPLPAGDVLGMESGNQRGLAVFQVRCALPAGVTTLAFETESQPQRGEDVYLVGFPEMAKAPLVLRRTFAGFDGNFLQLDLPAGEGLSGAPVLHKGKVVGIVTSEDLQFTFANPALIARGAVIGWGVKLNTQATEAIVVTALSSPVIPFEERCTPGEERTDNDIVFVRICPGTFVMGSAEDDSRAEDSEKPAHKVTLSEFWLGKTEVTNEQYRRFRPDHQGEARLPVISVTWEDARAACEHFGGRLPTEAEWEYAARAGSQTPWSIGDDEAMLAAYAWYGEAWEGPPHQVGSKKANAWGLHDMHGNVWEHVADWHSKYPGEAQTDPTGPPTGSARLVRGGAYFDAPKGIRSAIRGWGGPSSWSKSLGFRCARSSGRQP